MAQGKSGRIVVQIDPGLKARLYVELTKRQMTLKEWLIRQAEEFIRENRRQHLMWEDE